MVRASSSGSFLPPATTIGTGHAATISSNSVSYTHLTFCTSGSSGYGRTGEILAALTDESVNWIEGTRFSPSATAQEIEAWLAENGIVPYAAQ